MVSSSDVRPYDLAPFRGHKINLTGRENINEFMILDCNLRFLFLSWKYWIIYPPLGFNSYLNKTLWDIYRAKKLKRLVKKYFLFLITCFVYLLIYLDLETKQ